MLLAQRRARSSRRRTWTLVACGVLIAGLALSAGAALLWREKRSPATSARTFDPTRVERHRDARDVATPGRRFRHDVRSVLTMQPRLTASEFNTWYETLQGREPAGRKSRHRRGRTDPVPRRSRRSWRARTAIRRSCRWWAQWLPVSRDGRRLVLPARGGRRDRHARFGHLAAGPGGLVLAAARRSGRLESRDHPQRDRLGAVHGDRGDRCRRPDDAARGPVLPARRSLCEACSSAARRLRAGSSAPSTCRR